MVIVIYLIYGLLIILAIFIWPLRIHARKKTLKEIDNLRLTFQANTEQLISLINQKSIGNLKEEIYEKRLEEQKKFREELQKSHDFFVRSYCESFSVLLPRIKHEWLPEHDYWIVFNAYRTHRRYIYPHNIIELKLQERNEWEIWKKLGSVTKFKKLEPLSSYEELLSTI